DVPIVHTIPTWNFPREGVGRMPREGKIRIRQDIRDLLSLPNVHFEITPIAYGAAFEYPYTEAIPSVRPYYEEFGGSKFLWGGLGYAASRAVVPLPAGHRLPAAALELHLRSGQSVDLGRERGQDLQDRDRSWGMTLTPSRMA